MRFQLPISLNNFYSSMEHFVLLKNPSENLWYLNLFRNRNKKYIGFLNKEKKQFQLEPIVILMRAPIIKINVNVEEYNNMGVLIDIKFKIPIMVYGTCALLSVFFFIGLGIEHVITHLVDEKSFFETYPAVIIFPLVICLIHYLLFLLEKIKFLKRFKNLFEWHKN